MKKYHIFITLLGIMSLLYIIYARKPTIVYYDEIFYQKR